MAEIAINKFQKGAFGLTALASYKTGKVMFVAKEVADLWGHTNSIQAIKDAKLCSDEKLTIKKSVYPEFFEQLGKQNLVGSRASYITLISESGLWKLALNSKKKEADALKDWIAREVLPSLREKGSYSLNESLKNIASHTSVSIQKSNSKAVNKANYEKGGIATVVSYNRQSCILHAGKRPSEIKEIGKQLGLKSKQRSSAKEVLRNVKPQVACAMSFTDDLVNRGAELGQAAGLSMKHAAPLFEGILKMGLMPAEMNRTH